jgi:hypothetical protein
MRDIKGRGRIIILPNPTLSKGEGFNFALFKVLSFGEDYL